jgi:hypothetical protein
VRDQVKYGIEEMRGPGVERRWNITYLLCDWKSHSVVQLTELKYFIIRARFLGFELLDQLES